MKKFVGSICVHPYHGNCCPCDKKKIGALLDALKTWERFWDTMPKGQMGKLSFDVGLFNDGFVKMRKSIAQAEGK